VIAVLTDPRRPQHLAATLAGIDSSAASRARVVVVDGAAAPDLPPGWRAELAPKPPRTRPAENKWATWRAFELAAAAGEDLLFFEDDVAGCPGAAAYAEEVRVPTDCALLMLYAPWGDGAFPPRIWRYHASQFSFCQALKIPLPTCQKLAAARREMERLEEGGSDECIRAIGGDLDWLVGMHVPGLYQHVGMKSIVSGDRDLGGHRTSRCWLTDQPASDLYHPALRGTWR